MQIKETKILVPAYLTNVVYPFILKQNKEDAAFGIKIDNIHSLMSEEDYRKMSDEEVLMQTHSELKKHKDTFAVFDKVLDKMSFIEQFISFYRECVCYEIDIDSLPEDSDEEIEIKRIMKLIDSLELNIKNNYQHFRQKGIEYQIFNDFYGQFMEYRLFKKLLNEGCPSYKIEDIRRKAENISCLKTTTRGKELDAVALYIVNECDSSSTQVVIPKGVYSEDIARVFKAHDIPFRRVGYSKESMLVKKLREFIDFLIHKDLNSFLKVLVHNKGTEHLYEYASHFEIDVKEIYNEFKRFSFVDMDRILDLENKAASQSDQTAREKITNKIRNTLSEYRFLDIIDWSRTRPLVLLEREAEKERKQIENTVKDWLENDPYLSLQEFYNDIVENTDWKLYEHDYQAFTKAGTIIREAQKEDLELNILQELISKCRNNDEKTDSNAVTITDTDHLMMGKETTIILGAEEGVFLQALEKNGIIKEDYVEKIANYPSLEERLQFSELKMDLLKQISPNIIISYCYSDYAGKEHKLSSYIEKAFDTSEKKFTEWPDNKYEYLQEKNNTISKEKARTLFVTKDNGISGSVSSLETYQNCPYNYFLQKGIGISEQEGYQQVDPAVLGTLRHRIFELLGKDRFNDRDLLDRLLDGYMDELKKVFDGQKDELELKRIMIGNILKLNETIARKIAQSGSYTDAKQEYRLDRERVEAGEYHFNFTAIVDRIDYDDSFYRVVDYKSSNVRFSTTAFDEGKQLQLMTYLWLLWKKKQIAGQPVGAYYFDLNVNGENDIAKAKKSFESKEEAEALFEKKNSLQGLTLVPGNNESGNKDILKNGGYLTNVTSASDRRSEESKEKYDIDKIEGIDIFLSELYENIADRIVNGHFEKNASDDTCRYCSFSSICHKEKIEESEEEDAAEQ